MRAAAPRALRRGDDRARSRASRIARRLAAILACVAAACSAAREPVHEPAHDGATADQALSADEALSAESRGARGEELYLRHCAVCHGLRGRGDGEAAPFLFPPARDFGSGRFRLVSSRNGAPYDADLVATLRRGVPGSAMPAWSWLGEEDLAALAGHVRALAIEGLAGDLVARARADGRALPPAEARTAARARMTPDAPAIAPERERALADVRPASDAPVDVALIARGRALYMERCAQCHAADGRGEREPRLNEDGTLNWARDFTSGFLKGGDSARALARRIAAGLPGSAMPPNAMAPADESALIAYVQGLIPRDRADRLVHVRSELVARRVAAAPSASDDAVWDGAPSVRVVLAPLWWNEHAVLEATLAAVHDGASLALRLSWEDSTGDVRVFGDVLASDAAALQFSSAGEPALFGMGSPHEPTNLWHWQALRVEDVEGALDLVDPVGHAGEPPRPGEVRADVPLYQRLLGRIEPSERADRITVRGFATLAAGDRAQAEVSANAHWQGGRWQVAFRRALRPTASSASVVPLAPGTSVQVACAVWNGAAGDAGARKSISIWQDLRLGL